jgi:L-lactate dehydrogenase
MTHLARHPVKIAIVGSGFVGATFGYAMVTSGLAAEIVLIDANQARAEGEAMDLNHAVPLHQSCRIWAGDYSDCAGADVTVVTAGSAQKPGETRLDLTQRNADIFRQIIPPIARYNPDGILLIASNPVDVLTYAAIRLSGLPPERVIGSGTILDSARFRYLLSQTFGVDPRSVHAYIIGEHGDSEVPAWSLANIAGMRLPAFCAANGRGCEDDAVLAGILDQTRHAAYEIIQRKGATYYAIASALMRIVETILRDQSTVMTVSSLITGHYGISDVCLSLPTIVNSNGIQKVLNLELESEEIAGLQHSATVLRDMILKLNL